jgi:uncharacterized membrane protein YGL010W
MTHLTQLVYLYVAVSHDSVQSLQVITDCLLVQSYKAVHAMSQVEYSVIEFHEFTVFHENVQLASGVVVLSAVIELVVFHHKLFLTSHTQRLDNSARLAEVICWI